MSINDSWKSIIPVLEAAASSNNYAARVLAALTSSSKVETKLFLGSIVLAYKPIERFIWETEGRSLKYGEIKEEYQIIVSSFRKIMGRGSDGIVKVVILSIILSY